MPPDGVQPIPYRYLDPGVRELVRQLADHGFRPVDSGDGVSKCEHGRSLDFLHVFMVTEPCDLASEADRLEALLPALDREGVVVEATYRPSDGRGILGLLDLPTDGGTT